MESARQSGDLGKYATGAAGGGALALLLGGRRGRSLGGQTLYLVSALVADETTTIERAYLDELAQQLGLAPELKAALEAEARAC